MRSVGAGESSTSTRLSASAGGAMSSHESVRPDASTSVSTERRAPLSSVTRTVWRPTLTGDDHTAPSNTPLGIPPSIDTRAPVGTSRMRSITSGENVL